MSSEQKNCKNEFYEIFEDKKAIKFMNKHSDNVDLINRIYEKYLKLSVDPYNESENSFKIKKISKM